MGSSNTCFIEQFLVNFVGFAEIFWIANPLVCVNRRSVLAEHVGYVLIRESSLSRYCREDCPCVAELALAGLVSRVGEVGGDEVEEVRHVACA